MRNKMLALVAEPLLAGKTTEFYKVFDLKTYA
jgi:hypothetical protein